MDNNDKFKTKILPFEQGLLVTYFFINAFEDYLAARLLLLNGRLPQGCVLATTAIEKYFKGMLMSHGTTSPKHHDISARAFKSSMENKFKKIHDKINWEFVAFLARAYRLRYLDDLEKEYSIVIVRAKTLAELDFIVSNIEESFKIVNPKLGERENKYTYMKNTKSPNLVDFNFHLTGIEKTPFVQQVDDVYEFRKITNGEILEINYRTDKIIDDGKFLYDAVKPKEDAPMQSFSLCFEPINIE